MAPPGKGKGEQKPRHQRKEKRGRPLPKQGRAGPAAVNPCPRAHPAGLQTRQPWGPHALERTPARPPDRAHPQGPPPEHPSTRPRGTTAAPPHGRWCGLPGLACSWGPWDLLDGPALVVFKTRCLGVPLSGVGLKSWKCSCRMQTHCSSETRSGLLGPSQLGVGGHNT